MDAKQLKEVADKHGIEYAKNANAATMKKILAENDIHMQDTQDISVQEEAPAAPQPKSYTNFDHELKEAVALFKGAETSLELKRANQKRHVLKEKIKKEDNKEALKKLLVWERRHRVIEKADDYLLNEIEQAELSKSCQCINKIGAAGTYAQLGEAYPFTTYFDETRASDMYVIYVNRTIAPEEQIGKELAFKIEQGFMPSLEDYQKPKTVWHRLVLVEREFRKYFRVDGEEEVSL